MLTELGYSVAEAASAEQALSMLDAGANPTLILTDHLMAGMTGVELASQIRSRSLAVPVLLVSGYSDVDGIAAGMPRLVKPFRRDELAKALALLHDLPLEATKKSV
jgi:CheY-like chemotaxis protein